VVRDRDGDLSRIQVKTAMAKDLAKSGCFTADFSVPLAQLRTPITPDLTYAFVVRRGVWGWAPFVLIKRDTLNELAEGQGKGTGAGKTLGLHVRYEPERISWSEQDLTPYRENWARWLPIVGNSRL